jgi:hypothetical protein
MAYFDSATQQLVLQIVYDGAAFSGKTASIESLGRLLKKPVVSPDVDPEGRTLLFDWMEYEGGIRFGRPIVCRVLTVPGQPELAQRRRRLLRSADAVIFVADSRADSFPETVDRWKELHAALDRWGSSTPIAVQLNQRDHETALPAGEMKTAMRDALGERNESWTELVFETAAVQDRGIREALVMTVGETLRYHVADHTTRRLTPSGEKSADTQPIQILSPEQLKDVLDGHELWAED